MLLTRPRSLFVVRIHRAAWLAILMLFLPAGLLAVTNTSNVICRGSLQIEHREELAGKLRKITGWTDLKFDRSGVLRLGTNHVGGSAKARELLSRVVMGGTVVVLEDASKRADIAFCQVVPGKWKASVPETRPAFVVQIDFSDFENVMGDERALEAFNAGWGLLHELDHVVNNSVDATCLGEPGECETHINDMRRECGLPQRAEYFHTYSPLTVDSAFMPPLVQLSFEHALDKKKKRYLLVWDAKLIGGVSEGGRIAVLR
ncbi:MAG TPA: hypothetical protein VFD48_13970 [Pyrinomonadaceae bacterium]|nr:hypothetical protein [Pyrinomonadaceae bacterium]